MNADSSDIHRLLDEAFTGVTMTPELQDLKEELRGNLAARSAELQSKGKDAASAARTAVAELGSIPELIASVGGGGVGGDAGTPLSPGAAAAEVARLHRVRPKSGFVVRASVLSVAILAFAFHVILDLVQQRTASTLDAQLWTIGFAVLVAALVADSLHQETAQHYPMPLPRSIRWGAASGFLAAGIGYALFFFWHRPPLALLAAAIILTVAATMAMIALGVTQTNRLKPWALAQNRQYEVEDRFSQDPVAAARFGIYTVIIWLTAITLFVVLSIAVGFVWSWLALVAGLVVFFLVLARMLFAPKK
ncbi:MAG: permease prefix domain 1-containing protein [Pseudolysinimonas sp.]